MDGDKLGWPKGFRPEVADHKLVEPVRRDPFRGGRRVLGIRLEKLDLTEKDAPIEVSFCNAGGTANGYVGGDFCVYDVPKRAGKHWTVECLGTFVP